MKARHGKILAGAFLLPFAAWAARVEPLPALPPGELPNSEVVTNIALNVDFARLERLFFTLELNAGESNSLSIAVGAAAGRIARTLAIDRRLSASR